MAGLAKTPKTHRTTTDATKNDATETNAPETNAAEAVKVPADPEESHVGAFTPDYEVILPQRRRSIMQCCREDWGVPVPREFQIQAIYRGGRLTAQFGLEAR